MTTLAEFVAAAESQGATVRRDRDQYLVTCPLHDDKTPSLHAGESGGKLLLKAFCCDGTFEDLLAGYGFNGRKPTTEIRYRARTEAKPEIEETWTTVRTHDYLDETGKLLYRKVRQAGSAGGKRFFREPDGVESSLYRLELLHYVDGCVLFVSESEKDADTLIELSRSDLVAVSSGGASSWREEWSDRIAQAGPRLVAILQHNDDPGRAFAHRVAFSLSKRGLPVKVLAFEGEKGYDAADAIRDGLTIDGLVSRAESDPEWVPTRAGTDVRATGGLALLTLGDLLSMPPETTSWVWEGRIPTGGLAGLFAKPKGGKSTMARCLCLAVARKAPFLGFATSGGSVIYLGLEEKPHEVQAHFRALGATENDPIHVLIATAPADGLARLRLDAERIRPALIVIDTMSKLVRLKDGNDYAEVTNELEPVLALARETGAAVLFIHHLGKGERNDAGDAILGSTAIFAAVDTALLLKRTERYRTLSSIQRYGQDLEEITLALDSETRAVSFGGTREAADEERYGEEFLATLTAAPNPLTKDELFDEVEGRAKDKLRALKRLVSDRKVSRRGAGRKGDPYVFELYGSAVPPFPPLYTKRGMESTFEAQPVDSQAEIPFPNSRVGAGTGISSGTAFRKAYSKPTLTRGTA